MLAPPHRDQALGDEGAVEALQRHDVGDGAERDEIERVEQVRLRPQHVPEAAPAQFAVDRDHGHEHEPDRGEMAEPGKVVLPVRIDQRDRRRQRLVGLMMVDRRPRRGRARCASASGSMLVVPQSTVTSSRAPRLGERAHRLDVRPVALEQAVRNVDQRIDARSGAGSARAAPPRSRRRRRSRRRSRSSRRARPHRRCAPPPSACRSARRDRASAAARSDRGMPRPSSTSTPRPARTRASSSDTPWRCAIASARAVAALVEPVAPGAAGRRALDAEEDAAFIGAHCEARSSSIRSRRIDAMLQCGLQAIHRAFRESASSARVR